MHLDLTIARSMQKSRLRKRRGKWTKSFRTGCCTLEPIHHSMGNALLTYLSTRKRSVDWLRPKTKFSVTRRSTGPCCPAIDALVTLLPFVDRYSKAPSYSIETFLPHSTSTYRKVESDRFLARCMEAHPKKQKPKIDSVASELLSLSLSS